ncbi:cell division protein ZipA [Halomonas denitrificans]|nr:cell division protein ZipA [Halomonas denitrificans]
MDSLRLTLILIGLVILALIWMLHRPGDRARKPGATRRDAARRVEPGIAADRGDDRDPDASETDSDDEPAGGSGEPRQAMLPDLGSEAPDSAVDTIRRDDARRVRRTPDPSGDRSTPTPAPSADRGGEDDDELGFLKELEIEHRRDAKGRTSGPADDRQAGRSDRAEPGPAPNAAGKRPLLRRAAELVPRASAKSDAPARAPKADPQGRREPDLSAPPPAAEKGERVEPRWPGDEPEPSGSNAPRERVGPGASSDDAPRIVTLYLRARGERLISGLSLLDAAIKAGLRFGEMKIFHRRHQGAPKPVFSMANIARPGSFDPSAWNLFETPGVTLFMTLPGPVSGLDAWDAMLATGQRLSELLDADLMDDSQCLLTRQRIAQIREDLREYDRKAGLGL